MALMLRTVHTNRGCELITKVQTAVNRLAQGRIVNTGRICVYRYQEVCRTHICDRDVIVGVVVARSCCRDYGEFPYLGLLLMLRVLHLLQQESHCSLRGVDVPLPP